MSPRTEGAGGLGELTYSELTNGLSIFNKNTLESAVVEDRHADGFLMVRLTDGRDEGDILDLWPAEIIANWRKKY